MASRGVDAEMLLDERSIVQPVYQSVMRTSIRNPESTTEKVFIIPQITAAEYLKEAFPGSWVQGLKTGLIELERSSPRGRPREYGLSKERQQAYRQRKTTKA
jgi:hypothetical protein